MHTVEIGVYSFEELSEEAKDRVRENWKSIDGYNDHDEAMESLKHLAKHFGGELKDWEIDWFDGSYSHATFEMPDDMEYDQVAQRLGALGTFNPETGCGHGDCELTGYCHDEWAIDGFRQHWIAYGEPDLDKLMQAAFKTWLKACQSDCEHQYSDEAMQENCEANGYEFYEDGEMA